MCVRCLEEIGAVPYVFFIDKRVYHLRCYLKKEKIKNSANIITINKLKFYHFLR